MKFHLSHFWTLYDILDSRYVGLKYSKKSKSINESKQILKSHISASECRRRVYKGSNWRSWCQFLYFKSGCLYFGCWIEIRSFKITKKMQFFQIKKNVFEEPYLDLEMSYNSLQKLKLKVLKSILIMFYKTSSIFIWFWGKKI